MVRCLGARLYEMRPRPELPREYTRPPNNVHVPCHHETVTYKEFTFILPASGVGEHFYVVTHGTLVGVFLHW